MPPELDIEMLNSELLKDGDDTRPLMLNREQAQLLTRVLAELDVRAAARGLNRAGTGQAIDPDTILYG